METKKTIKMQSCHDLRQFSITKNLINNLSQFEVTPTAKLVLLYLSDCYNPKKADVFPKQKTIASKLGVSERSIVRAIEELINEGLILKECKYTNRYKFTSRIVDKQPENEKKFKPVIMSDNKRQNDIKQNDKLALPIHEQIREQKKNTKKEDDFKILLEYANKKQVSKPLAYARAILNNGNYKSIIDDMNAQQRAKEQAEKRMIETKQLIKTQEKNKITAVSPLDFNKDEAISFIKNLPEMCRSVGSAKILIEKYQIQI